MPEINYLQTYRGLEKELFRIRKRHDDAESPEEDDLLEEMDDVWWKLTETEREILNQE